MVCTGRYILEETEQSVLGSRRVSLSRRHQATTDEDKPGGELRMRQRHPAAGMSL